MEILKNNKQIESILINQKQKQYYYDVTINNFFSVAVCTSAKKKYLANLQIVQPGDACFLRRICHSPCKHFYRDVPPLTVPAVLLEALPD